MEGKLEVGVGRPCALSNPPPPGQAGIHSPDNGAPIQRHRVSPHYPCVRSRVTPAQPPGWSRVPTRDGTTESGGRMASASTSQSRVFGAGCPPRSRLSSRISRAPESPLSSALRQRRARPLRIHLLLTYPTRNEFYEPDVVVIVRRAAPRRWTSPVSHGPRTENVAHVPASPATLLPSRKRTSARDSERASESRTTVPATGRQPPQALREKAKNERRREGEKAETRVEKVTDQRLIPSAVLKVSRSIIFFLLFPIFGLTSSKTHIFNHRNYFRT